MVIWSSNVLNSMANSSAQLLDTGNLVLQGNSSTTTLWESFQHPTDSYIERMRLNAYIRNDQKIMLTSWRSPSDPSIRSFSFGFDPPNIPEMFVWNGSRPFWRSSPWNGQVFIGLPYMNSMYGSGFSLVNDIEGSTYVTYAWVSVVSQLYYGLSSEGILTKRYWKEGLRDWEISWSRRDDECFIYGMCGPFGICNSGNSPICSCLDGFEPLHVEEWSKGNWTSICVRRRLLQCDRNTTTIEKVKEDGFLQFPSVKVPDFAEWLALTDIDSCRNECLSNCFCKAYTYSSGIRCMHWNGCLIDIMKFSGCHWADLYVRVTQSLFLVQSLLAGL